MDREELKRRTKEFAHRCVKLALALPKGPLGDHVRKQLIKCGTSVGANYRAACVAQSRPDFVAKLSIVIEEVDESCFWLEFIIDESLLKESRATPLLIEGRELRSIFIKSRKTTRARTNDK
jgi:four helix bundle protein